jgi:hypothetical protein
VTAGSPSGAALFARYAYPPNALGYCGPVDAPGLLRAGADGRGDAELAHRARRFDGAWPYLQLIAASNRIPDPLDRRVVEAYWLGNRLLRRVPPATLATSLDARFGYRAGRRLAPLVAAGTVGIAQHSFHVFAVYPWVGLLRTGAAGPALEVLDRCRIRWGTVQAVAGDDVTVRVRPLRFDGSRLLLGSPRLEPARCRLDGTGFVEDVAPGDTVALHWDWVCDRLSPGRLWWLRYCTSRNLAAVNSSAVPGPAAVGGA